ncbi:hypothetical protein LZ32DRAFT_13689 [Colletotrichum eremochloae]|nr:hypothetical protein LZ32DRAFT_13689 [Colletotrichum eremochloae]
MRCLFCISISDARHAGAVTGLGCGQHQRGTGVISRASKDDHQQKFKNARAKGETQPGLGATACKVRRVLFPRDNSMIVSIFYLCRFSRGFCFREVFTLAKVGNRRLFFGSAQAYFLYARCNLSSVFGGRQPASHWNKGTHFCAAPSTRTRLLREGVDVCRFGPSPSCVYFFCF